MFYEESSRTLEATELARLAFRRNMELGMLAVLGGGLAAALGLPLRLNVASAVKPILVAAPLGLAALLEVVFFMLRRSPSSGAIERFSRAIEARRQAGARVAALSRTFIVLAGVLAFVFALVLVMVIPIK